MYDALGERKEGPPTVVEVMTRGSGMEPPIDRLSSTNTMRCVVMCIVNWSWIAFQEEEGGMEDGRGRGELPSQRSSMLFRTSVSTSSGDSRVMRPEGERGAGEMHVRGDHVSSLFAIVGERREKRQNTKLQR